MTGVQTCALPICFPVTIEGHVSGDYFSRPEMSQSKLKGFAKSPAQYKYMQDNPKKPTRDMEIGTAIHYYLLEPEEFKKRYFIEDKYVDGRTKAGKEYKALVKDQEITFGKIILSKDEGDTVIGCANAALEDEDVGFLFKEGIEVEREVFFPLFGIDFKAKLDVVVPKYNALLDVKSTALMSNDSFVKMAVSNSPMCHYDIQAYVYVEAYKHCFGEYPASAAFIGLEKSAPYHCHIYEYTPLS